MPISKVDNYSSPVLMNYFISTEKQYPLQTQILAGLDYGAPTTAPIEPPLTDIPPQTAM